MKKILVLVIVAGILTVNSVSDAAENKFTNTFLYRIGAAFTSQDVIDIHKYDLIAVQGFRWAQVNGDTWGELKKLNPDILIFPYYGSHSNDNEDIKTNPYKGSMGRWNISRGHSMGNTNTDNPDLFYLTSSGNRISAGPAYPNSWALDYGDPEVHQYWLEAYITDNVNQPWEADGVMLDTVPVRFTGLDGTPAGYSDAGWQMDMQSYLNTLSEELANHNQIIWGNTGVIQTQEDIDAYIGLDNIANPIYMGNSEGAFVCGWGGGDCQFFAEHIWLKQVEISRHIHRMKYGMQSFVKHEGSNFEHSDTGIDNYGESVTVKDALWYGLCSYHLGKNTVDNNTHFSFTANTYSDAIYYDEYDIDLGNAIDTFKVTNIGGNNIYYREFEKGYVYVNPTRNNVLNIPLPETCKQLTHTNFKNDPATISNTTTINLVSHRGTFLLKSDGGEIADTIIPQTNWSLLYVDSEETVGEDGAAVNSFDGDPDTIWHTRWYDIDPDPPHPHEIQIDLGDSYELGGFRYLPRQDDNENGMIDEYEFYVSTSGTDWEQLAPVASGNLVADKTEKTVLFNITQGQYIRLVALSEVNDGPWTTIAELNVLVVQHDTDINKDGKVNVEDFAVLSVWWDDENACSSPDWCEGADFDMSGTVDMLDLTYFAENWLRQ